MRTISRVVNAGTLSDLVLVMAKGGAGVATGSSALISDAAHSVADVLISLTTLIVTRFSAKKPDNDHPFGHGRIDSLGALAVSGLLATTGGTIMWRAFQEVAQILQGHTPPPLMTLFEDGAVPVEQLLSSNATAGIAIGACALSMGLKEAIYRWTMRVGLQMRSQALIANAWHHRADSLSSLVAAVGIGGALAGFPVLDPLAAMAVAAMIGKAGLETGYNAVRELMDTRLDDDLLAVAVDTVREQTDVLGIRRIRSRRAGPAVLLDCELAVSPGITVGATDAISEAIKTSVFRERREVAEMLIHFVPADEHDCMDAPQYRDTVGEEADAGHGAGGQAAGTEAAEGHGHSHGGGHGHSHGAATSGGRRPQAVDAEHDDAGAGRAGSGAGAAAGVASAAASAASGATSAAAAPAASRYSIAELRDIVRQVLLTGQQQQAGSSSSGSSGATGIRHITALDVHAESAASRLLHVHARVVVDMETPVRGALAVVRRSRAALKALSLPVHKPAAVAAVAGGAAPAAAAARGGSAGTAGAALDSGAAALAADGEDQSWRVAVADVQLETEPV